MKRPSEFVVGPSISEQGCDSKHKYKLTLRYNMLALYSRVYRLTQSWQIPTTCCTNFSPLSVASLLSVN